MFDIVWAHFKANGFKPSVDGNACVYRAPDGNKCAVGALIPDEKYRPGFETWPIATSEDDYTARVAIANATGAAPADLPFLRAMQRAHDERADLQARLSYFAVRHNLKVPA